MKTIETAKDLMIDNPLLLNKSQSLSEAVQAMLEQNVAQAMVVDGEHNLLGMVSCENVLSILWLNDFEPGVEATVEDAMQRKVVTMEAEDSIRQVAEKMTVASKAAFPVSQDGILLDYDAVSLSSRVEKSSQRLPDSYPVLDHHKVVGLINRQQVVAAYQDCFAH